MVKYFAMVTEWIRAIWPAPGAQAGPGACPDWLRDPMSHPQIAGMSAAGIADLPAGQLRSLVRE